MPAFASRHARTLLVVIAAAVAFLTVVLPTQRADAHPAGTTGVFVTVQDDAVELEMQIQLAGFVAATGYEIGTDESALDAVSENLMTFILHRVHVSDDVSTLTAEVIDAPRFDTVNDEDAIVTTLRFADAGRSLEGDIVLDDTFILDVVPAHQVYVALVSDWANGAVDEGEPRVLGVLGGGVTELTITRTAPTALDGFFAVVRLGMLHIAEGTDHLLFLTTLLIVAPSLAVRRAGHRLLQWTQPIPLRRTLLRAVLIITSFTAGHLVTLALVSLGLVSFPEKPVETLVAVSIVVAGIHALRPLARRGELLIAGGFGLVHGTAFATTILDLNLGFGEKIAAIVGFNIGIELAQLIAALLVLPLLIWLSHARAYGPFRVAVAVCAIVAAAAWIIAIQTDGDSALQPLFDGIAAQPVLCYAGLVLIVAVLWYLTRGEAMPVGTGASVAGGADGRHETAHVGVDEDVARAERPREVKALQ